MNDVPLDADHLPDDAKALFDCYRDHQQVLRLSVWAKLERPDTSATDAVRDATKAKIDAIATAQRAGIVSDRLGPSELLAVVIQLSLTGGDVLPILGVPSPPDVRRTSVGTAVAALTEPTVRR